jgi:hypothetical protein
MGFTSKTIGTCGKSSSASERKSDLFRRIGMDERVHKEESLARIQKARFA